MALLKLVEADEKAVAPLLQWLQIEGPTVDKNTFDGVCVFYPGKQAPVSNSITVHVLP